MIKKCLMIMIILLVNIFAVENKQMFQTVHKKDAILVKTDNTKIHCNICGMNLIKFYKTSHAAEFKDGHKEQYCSLNCLAQTIKDKGNQILKMQVVDTQSLKLIDVKKAYYVVGSSIKGTMSSVSKYAFLEKKDAEEFINKHGGTLKSFQEALDMAIKDL